MKPLPRTTPPQTTVTAGRRMLGRTDLRMVVQNGSNVTYCEREGEEAAASDAASRLDDAVKSRSFRLP